MADDAQANPATPPVQSTAAIAAGIIGTILATLPADQLQLLAQFIGTTTGEALKPIIEQEIKDALSAFQNTAEIGVQNNALEAEFIRTRDLVDCE